MIPGAPPVELAPELLQRCLRDLVGLVALPSMTRGLGPAGVLDVCLDALVSAVPAEIAYLALGNEAASPSAARFRGEKSVPPAVLAWAREVCGAPVSGETDGPPGFGRVQVARLPLAMGAGGGALVMASRRKAFPTATEGILLQVGRSLIAGAIDNARLLHASREAERRKDDFVALLGHELRNPLAPIVTALDLLRQRDEASTEEHAIIERQVHHMRALVDDLLDVARITRGKVTLSEEDLDLDGVLAAAVEMAGGSISAGGHTLIRDIEPHLVLRGDRRRLVQVFSNLLHNAAKFMAPGGIVKLVARGVGDELQISVHDDGEGIPAEALRTIWEPFEQMARTGKRVAGGLGLGLALVRSIVEIHGGTASARSDGPGQGSTFEIVLPALPRGCEPSPPPPLSRAVPPSDRSFLILVVDDNEDAAVLLARALRAMGHRTMVAHDGESAVELAHTQRADLALVDIGLPGIDGYETARRLRSDDPRIALIALSGFEPDDARTEESPFALHLIKPLDLGVLSGQVAKWVAKSAGITRSV